MPEIDGHVTVTREKATPVDEDARFPVLIVDDEAFIAHAAARALRAEGLLVETCLDWLDISKAVHRLRPRLILLDVNMPTISGRDVCTILRAHTKNFPAPPRIVFYSAEPEEDLSRYVVSCGADGFIHKSTPVSEFVRRVRMELSLAGRGRRQDPGEEHLRPSLG